jgi:hypothetical protein
MGRGSLALVLLLAAAPARGQGKSPRVDITRPEIVLAGTGVATTTISGVLSEGNRRDLLLGGWPTAIHGRLELWRKGFLGTYDRESDFQWDVIIDYSAVTKVFHLRRVIDNAVENLGETSTIEEAERILSRPFSPPLSPGKRGDRYFYLFNAEVATMSLSDLDAWQRWVKGEARPAVQGKRNPIGAFQRGLGSLLSRVLGGDTQSYERRSTPFSAG